MLLEVQLQQADDLEYEDADEDDEVERPGGEVVADSRNTRGPLSRLMIRTTRTIRNRRAREEVEDSATAAEVAALRRRRGQAVAEVDQEDQGERDVDVEDQLLRLGLEWQRNLEHEVDDREDRDREDEELVGCALQVLARDSGWRDLAAYAV